MAKLYLIRHGAVLISPGVCYGQSDVLPAQPVSTLAEKLRNRLPEAYSLWSSPLTRCRLLAEELGKPRIEPNLMEMYFGDWEMRPYKDIKKNQIDAWATNPFTFCPPNGESVKDMSIRVLTALTTILACADKCGNIVVVSHAGPMRVILGAFLKQHFEEWAYREINYGELICLDTLPSSLNFEPGNRFSA